MTRRLSSVVFCGCLVLGLVLAVAACGRTAAGMLPASTGRVGSTLALSDGKGGTADVTLLKVVDPARRVSPDAGPASGTRLVGVVLKIANTGSGELKGNILFSAALVGSDQATYSSELIAIKSYKALPKGVFVIPPQRSVVGAATFELPRGVKVGKIELDLNSGSPGDRRGEWSVP